ncbi:MAG: hypothetical protein M1839_009132 [Geoglossum umbratile]|nr:MAG: hypothetical protein M1839_009132 [Geoglossum umbratile]
MHYGKHLNKNKSLNVQAFIIPAAVPISSLWVYHVTMLWKLALLRIKFFTSMTFIIAGSLFSLPKVLFRLHPVQYWIRLPYIQEDVQLDNHNLLLHESHHNSRNRHLGQLYHLQQNLESDYDQGENNNRKNHLLHLLMKITCRKMS